MLPHQTYRREDARAYSIRSRGHEARSYANPGATSRNLVFLGLSRVFVADTEDMLDSLTMMVAMPEADKSDIARYVSNPESTLFVAHKAQADAGESPPLHHDFSDYGFVRDCYPA